MRQYRAQSNSRCKKSYVYVVDERGNNFYDFCYSDEFATAFLIKDSRYSNYTNCFAFWYSKRGEKHIVFKSEGKFNSYV